MADKRTKPTKPGREHKETVKEAEIGPVSVISIVAGTLGAYGAFILVAALAGALLSRADVDEFQTNDWTGSGAVAALASALVLLVAYLFGGYVAGRMARRAGLIHGLAVAVLSLVLGAIIGGVVTALEDENGQVGDNLQSIGVPTSSDQITGDVAIAGMVLSLAAIIIGGILGGILGERWHTKLARRAADPSLGPAAEARARADREDDERHRRIDQDEPVRRDVAGSDRHRDEPTRREATEPDSDREDPARRGAVLPDRRRDEPARHEAVAPDRPREEPARREGTGPNRGDVDQPVGTNEPDTMGDTAGHDQPADGQPGAKRGGSSRLGGRRSKRRR